MARRPRRPAERDEREDARREDARREDARREADASTRNTRPADRPDELTEDEEKDKNILQEAQDRLRRVVDWEAPFRQLYPVDVKFANADPDNGWQWPDALRRDREDNKRPALTINKVASMVAMITNDARQNKPSVSIKPTSRDASFEAAQAYEGIVRNIEYMSGAQAIYDDMFESQVEGGIGWCLLTTKYVNDDPEAGHRVFDQDIRIEPVRDQLSVYLDCDIKQRDGSDAQWGFIVEEELRKDFEREHPDADVTSYDFLELASNWLRNDYILTAEYYRIVVTYDELIWMVDDNQQETTFRRKEMPKELAASLKEIEKEHGDDPTRFKKRKVAVKQLEWYKIAGCTIVDRRKLKGQYVPLVRAVGRERIIEGKLERKGFVRPLKDAQRMYNYNTSGQVEYGALATKTPWVGAAAAFEGNTQAWNNSNKSNAAYLTFNHMDSDGNPLPPEALPKKPEAPGASPAFLEGMKIAAGELDMIGGQFSPSRGEPSNERSGKAITERTRNSDRASYHFTDNQALAIRYIGKIIVDWVPFYYDTERVIQILGRDNAQTMLSVDPNAEKPYQEQKAGEDKIAAIFNPKVGKYEVQADVGPAYATQRMEAWNAFVQIVTGAPELINDIGDLMFLSADFPIADKIAERIKRKIKAVQPWLLDDDAATPAMQKVQGELQQATQQVAELLEQLGDEKRKNQSWTQKRDINAYTAETDRMAKAAAAMKNLAGDAESGAIGDVKEMATLIHQTIADMYGQDLTEDINAQQEQAGQREPQELQQIEQQRGEAPGGEQAPVPGARKAPDGMWYAPDPSREGKFLRIHMNGAARPA